MIIKVPHTQTIDIYIDDDTANEIMMTQLYKLFNWEEGYWISKLGELLNKYEVCGSHRFDMNEKVREATVEDIETNNMFNKIKQLKDK